MRREERGGKRQDEVVKNAYNNQELVGKGGEEEAMGVEGDGKEEDMGVKGGWWRLFVGGMGGGCYSLSLSILPTPRPTLCCHFLSMHLYSWLIVVTLSLSLLCIHFSHPCLDTYSSKLNSFRFMLHVF